MSRERAFNHALAAIDEVAGAWDLYTAYVMREPEYIGTRIESLEETRAWLSANGYDRHYLAAAKYHHEPHRAVDHASYRRVPDEHPDVDAAITEEYDPIQCHYHLHLWPTNDGIEFYGHYERRGDLHPVGGESVLEAMKRAKAHYNDAVRGEYYLRGVTDLDLDE